MREGEGEDAKRNACNGGSATGKYNIYTHFLSVRTT